MEVDLQTCAHVIPGNYCATWVTWDPSNDLAFEYLSKAAQYLGNCYPLCAMEMASCVLVDFCVS